MEWSGRRKRSPAYKSTYQKRHSHYTDSWFSQIPRIVVSCHDVHCARSNLCRVCLVSTFDRSLPPRTFLKRSCIFIPGGREAAVERMSVVEPGIGICQTPGFSRSHGFPSHAPATQIATKLLIFGIWTQLLRIGTYTLTVYTTTTAVLPRLPPNTLLLLITQQLPTKSHILIPVPACRNPVLVKPRSSEASRSALNNQAQWQSIGVNGSSAKFNS